MDVSDAQEPGKQRKNKSDDLNWLQGKPNPKPIDDEPWFTG